MIYGVSLILLPIVCICLSASTEIEEVKPRWIYKDNRNNTNSLPDSIHIDLQLESAKITLNLIRIAKSTEAFKKTFFATTLEGQSSNDYDNEFLGTYKDLLFGATATVTIQNTNGIKETLYMISFTYDDKPVSLGPKAIIEDKTIFENLEEAIIGGNKNNYSKYNNKILNIDGVLHKLLESLSKPSQRNNRSYEANGTFGQNRIMKRSEFSRRPKRLMTVEIFTIIDYSIFNVFLKLNTANSDQKRIESARNNIMYVFTHIMERLKEIYENIVTNNLKFTTKWVGAFIAERTSDVPFINNSKHDQDSIESEDIFDNHKEWFFNKSAQPDRTKWPKFDFLAIFTRYAIIMDKNPIVGISYLKKVCTFQGLGIAKYRGPYEAALTLAHELGHSLGADHDREHRHCNTSNYIMDYTTHGQNHFSRCSIEAFTSTVAELDANSNNCLADDEEHFDIGQQRNISMHLYPGQIFDPDEQCRIVYGPESFFYGSRISSDREVCRSISCFKGNNIRTMDGTTCGNNSWCQKGKCVHDRNAPRSRDYCIYGDYKLEISFQFSRRKNLCKDEIMQNPIKVCKYYTDACCASCAGNGTSKGGCSDTIDTCSSLEPRDCYNDYYATTCCKTCQALVINPSDANCLYGDRGTECSNLIPEICHLPTRHCCETCAEFCINNGDYSGSMEFVHVWGFKENLTCKQLVERDSGLCRNDRVRRYCCSSCSNVNMMEDKCEDDDRVPHVYLSKKYTCKKLVEYLPRLCEIHGSLRKKCCKSCGQFTIRPL